jgi:site-specific DNA recombinase
MRLIGYTRVSDVNGRVGESFISEAVQVEKITAYGSVHGHEIIDLVSDLDESGGKMDRPGMSQVLAMIEGGEADGVIVYKIDRFARTLDGALQTIKALAAADAELVSVSDHIDTSTPTGKFGLHVLLSVAELQRDQIADSWQSARKNAIDRGVFMGTAPIGYVKAADGRLVVDEEAAGRVRAAFEARAQGAGTTECAALFGVKGRSTAAYLLQQRAYLGEARHGEFVNAAAHEPLIDRVTFERAQLARQGAAPRRRGDDEGFLLAGLIRCAHCRRSLGGDRKAASYKCGNQFCGERAAIKAETVEAIVRDWYEAFTALPSAEREAVEGSALRVALEEAETERRAFVQKVRPSHSEFGTWLEALDADVSRCKRDLAGLRARTFALLDPAAPVPDQRRLLTAAIHCIFVRSAKHGDDRVRVLRAGSAEPLPVRGRAAEGAKPLPPYEFGIFGFGERDAKAIVHGD